jgi:hypothetical protein
VLCLTPDRSSLAIINVLSCHLISVIALGSHIKYKDLTPLAKIEDKQITVDFAYIWLMCQENKIDLLKLMREKDPLKTNLLDRVQLTQILMSLPFGILMSEVQTICNKEAVYDSETGKIYYNKLFSPTATN